MDHFGHLTRPRKGKPKNCGNSLYGARALEGYNGGFLSIMGECGGVREEPELESSGELGYQGSSNEG